LLPYLKIARTCNHSTSECFADTAYCLDGKKNSYFSGTSNHTYNFVLSNGTVVGIGPRRENVAEVYIDLNGKGKPNKLGIDHFVILIVKSSPSGGYGKITKAGVYFWGSGYDRDYLKTTWYPCSKSNGTLTGLQCGALIMQDGWKIADDYPW
jgi:hypothetical protein